MLYNIKSVYLHCVFHGIRFKVNKDWVSGKIPFFFCVCTPSFFFCTNKRKTKQKENSPSAFFYLLQHFSPLNKKNSLRSNSFLFLTLQKALPLNGKKKRPDLYPFQYGINFASLVMGVLQLCTFALNNPSQAFTTPLIKKKASTSNSEAHLPPIRFRHLVEERKENRADFREEQKAV